LKTKAKLLSAELAVLVTVRRGLIQERLKKKMKLRRHRLKVKQSIKIQKVMRGFLLRLELKKMRAAAVIIQRVWRGYLVRYQQKQAMDGFEGSLGSDSTPPRKMRKIVKTRTNPDGEQQEYYDYESDDTADPDILDEIVDTGSPAPEAHAVDAD
jgi:hypothetical protein